MGALFFGCLIGYVGSIPAAGPLALLIAAEGIADRRRRGLTLAAGGALAESLWALLAYLGASAVVKRLAPFASALEVASALLVLGLGVAFVATRRTVRTDDAAAAGTDRPSASLFATGFSLVALNPGFFAFWLGATASLRGLVPTLDAQPALFAAGAFAGIVLWFSTLLALARALGARLSGRAMARLPRVVGGALVVLGAVLLVRALVRL